MKSVDLIPAIIFSAIVIITTSNIIKVTNKPENKNKIIYREPTPEEEKVYLEKSGKIKIQGQFYSYLIDKEEKLKDTANLIGANCKDDKCKVEKYFDYVKAIPYKKGEIDKDKNAVDVVLCNEGDCDEKSSLLVSLLQESQKKYKSVLVYTNTHTFACVNIPNLKEDRGMSYIKIDNEKYYYAETTNMNAKVGDYNNIEISKFKFVLEPIGKKEIPISKISFNINH